MGLPDDMIPPPAGPEPVAPVFPFAEANTLRTALTTLSTTLTTAKTGIDGLVGGLSAWEGDGRTAFDTDLVDDLDSIDTLRTSIDDDVDQLDTEIAAAQLAAEQHVVDHAAWVQRRDARAAYWTAQRERSSYAGAR